MEGFSPLSFCSSVHIEVKWLPTCFECFSSKTPSTLAVSSRMTFKCKDHGKLLRNVDEINSFIKMKIIFFSLEQICLFGFL